MSELSVQAASAREAALKMQAVSTETKNRALIRAAALLKESTDSILEANLRDLEAAREKGMSQAFIERLTLSEKRIGGMAAGLLEVAALPDPVGEVLEKWQRPNGLQIEKRRVPIGVIAIIYESRPNVTVDAAALCLKSGNAVVLRGGSDAIE